MNWYLGCESFCRVQAPLAGLTWYQVGGPAEFFATPPDKVALARLLQGAACANQPVRVLGHGSNLLIADAGVKGLVVQLPKAGFGGIERSGRCLRVGAGLGLSALVNRSVSEGLHGLECLQGIPGTVGAALRMNAGGKHGEIGRRVRRVCGLNLDGTPFDLAAADCGFAYRGSRLSGTIITECELELSSGDHAIGRMLLAEILNDKTASQPLAARSAGCVFKNPRQLGVPPAGKLIDDLGLKSLRVGGASVSTMHANFLVCDGEARARDVVELIRQIRQRVYDARGVMLELEIEVWGIEAEELMPSRRPLAA